MPDVQQVSKDREPGDFHLRKDRKGRKEAEENKARDSGEGDDSYDVQVLGSRRIKWYKIVGFEQDLFIDWYKNKWYHIEDQGTQERKNKASRALTLTNGVSSGTTTENGTNAMQTSLWILIH